MNAAPPPTLLRWTRFASDPSGTGPDKRSHQILTLAREAGFQVSDMRPPERTPRLQTLLAGLSARLRHGFSASVDHAGLGLLGYRALFYRRALSAHTGARVLLWETTYDDLLPGMARDAGFKIVAIPHNLESLVSERVFGNPTYDPTADLQAEVRRLGRAEKVFTISREERWLLEARGLSPGYLPFFPAGELAGECARVRARRVAAARPDGCVAGPLLILGSAFNPATARGMRQQLEWLRSSGATNEVAVVGPRTEAVLAEFASPRVRVCGGVSRERLVDLLGIASALLIHTHGGGGAVTRIPEALLAGLPVIANSNAARDQHNTPGVHGYESQEDFLETVSRPTPIPPLPQAPATALREFKNTLARLAGAPRPHA